VTTQDWLPLVQIAPEPMWRRSKRQQQQSTLGSFGVSYLKDNQGIELLAFAMKAMPSGWSAIRKLSQASASERQPEQIEDFNHPYRSWGQGTVRITLLPGRKNLLHLRE
jgi:hypothetical protein